MKVATFAVKLPNCTYNYDESFGGLIEPRKLTSTVMRASQRRPFIVAASVLVLGLMITSGSSSLHLDRSASSVTSSATTSGIPSLQVITSSAVAIPGYNRVSALPSSFPILVTVAVPLNNLALMQSMEVAISNPQSPEFRQFLSQQTIQQLFLPVAKYQSTLSYLKSSGFSIVSTAEDSIIVASTTVGQLRSALGLSTTLYSNGRESYYSTSGSATLPGVYAYASNLTTLLAQHPSITVPATTNGAPTPRASASPAAPEVTGPSEAHQASLLTSAYNATSLIASGFNGKGKTIGIFEFGGTPYMAAELKAYDRLTGLPAPPSFKIVPVGPYDPNLGTADVEEELDVEFSHAMAPGAGMIVYVGNDALNWAPIIATVDQQDAVNVLSQSWLEPEPYFSLFGPGLFDFNVVFGDQYFLLGSLEGITFSAASGDRGGVGYGAQPLGSASWPESSPYVTSVGGTTTYLTFQGSNVVSSLQTAWSNLGFEPNLANFGGGTGGVSSVEPKPWYQDGIPTPSSYVNGRLTPDLSLDASGYPGVYVLVDSREVSSHAGYTWLITGGTSEASPLLAGLVCDVDTAILGSLGLLNPTIYQIGESSLYTKAFTPITFGYNSPWVDKFGFNLVNGWGAPNIGEWASYFASVPPGSTPSIQVSISNSSNEPQYEFTAGQKIVITAVPESGTSATTSVYRATLVTLEGTVAKTTLKYSAALEAWTGSITVPSVASGMSNVDVQGTVGGTPAFGFAQVFTSYLATVITPFASQLLGTLPWSSLFGFNVSLAITDLYGNLIASGSYSLTASSYSIASNTYTPFVSNEALTETDGLWNAPFTSASYPVASVNIVLNGVYGFVSFQNGVSLVPSFILPPTTGEDDGPGSVSPGQYLQVMGELQAPVNTPDIISEETDEPLPQTIEQASTIIASLVSPSGVKVSSVNVGASGPSSFFGFPTNFLGYLKVPNDAAPGLYRIVLQSHYQSIDLNEWVNGTYFSQVLVASQPAIVPQITLTPNPVAEGKKVQIRASITYANGQEVKYGAYSATLYPAYDASNYASYSDLPAGEIPLWYDPSLNLWVGNVVMPSSTSLGWIGGFTFFAYGLAPGVVSQPVSGPWDAYVSGISWDGVPTTTVESAQQGFSVSA